MSKAAITGLFAAAFVTVVAGSIIGTAAWVTAVAGGGVILGGPQGLIAVNGASFTGVLGWLVVGWALVALGALGALVSWIEALLNTVQLEDRTWFLALLILGLCSFGWLAMIAYILRGPDATRVDDARGSLVAAKA